MDRNVSFWKWASHGVCAGLACVYLTGCGSSTPTPPAPAADTKTAQDTDPKAVVGTFLEAIRTGKDKEAELLLTKVAREENAKAELQLTPPTSGHAKYEVGEAEIVEGGAQVFSTWSEPAEDGSLRTEKIVWLLRNEPEGWRIAGMATTVFEGEPPLILNFEDPEDILYKQKALEEEIARRERAAAEQAQGGTVAAGQPAGEQPVQQAQKPGDGPTTK